MIEEAPKTIERTKKSTSTSLRNIDKTMHTIAMPIKIKHSSKGTVNSLILFFIILYSFVLKKYVFISVKDNSLGNKNDDKYQYA